MIDDATERADIERLRRHAVRDGAIAGLARDAAHDLKGALNILAMNLELLARAAQDPSARLTAEQAERCAAAVQRQLRRIDQTIDVVLGARDADGGRLESMDLSAVVERLLALAAGRAARQHVEIAYTAGTPVRLVGDPVRLQAALLALIVNALEAMPDGGRLEIAVSPAPASLTIRDTGSGVPADRVETMWDVGVSGKPGAQGLGLPVARAIVQAHGGTIRYTPNPAGGSTFVVELPMSS
jgi:signal transduction histidine kinase